MRGALVAGVLLTLAACGGDGESSDSDAGPQARERQAANPPAAPREEKPAAARSDRECLELWNSDVQPGTVSQKSTSDFVAEIAAKHPVDALARYITGKRDCMVVVPFAPGAKAAWVFVAIDGRAPYYHPSQLRLPRGRMFAFNTRTNPDGTLE
jgi:hypothetical protein